MRDADRPRRPGRGTLAGLLAALLVGGAAGSAGGETGERIASFDVRIQIERSGRIIVTETIVYDFGPNERHGIFRDIPVRFRYDDTYDRVYPLEVRSVRGSPGTPVGYQVEEEGSVLRIRIGDPDRTISGRHTYELTYAVDGALNGFGDHDELYWNAVGTAWPVPVSRAAVTVRAPGPVARVACFAGPEGSGLPCAAATARGERAAFRHRGLGPHEGLTVVVGLPKGAVPEPRPVLKERWSLARAFAVTPFTLGAALALALAAAVALARLLWIAGRDRRYRGSPVDVLHGNPTGEEQAVPLLEAGEGPVEFAPPEGLRPGQVGTLLDERANPLDVTATIVDLAVRGYLAIEEVPERGWFRKPDWVLRETRPPDAELLRYERLLLEGLFRDGGTVRLSELRQRFRGRLERVQRALYEDAVDRGWFPARPDLVRRRWALIGAGLAVAGGLLVLLAARSTHLGIVPVPVALAGVALAALSGRMPRRTAAGTGMVRRLRGFRRVIETAEAHMARWAEEEHVFSRYLPFAVVFGLTEKWARAFEGLAAAPPGAGWYVGSHPGGPASFAEAIDGFAVTTAGTIASTPSASGGSGFSGGSSGGGGGGGGGGSW